MAKNKTATLFYIMLPFLAGLAVMLIIGWIVFPQIIYTRKEQPLNFSHKIHVEKESLSCSSCHHFDQNGQFLGIPRIEKCVECHSDPVLAQKNPQAEKLLKEYLLKDKEVPWLVYQYQPDNVFFSHSAHRGFNCTECHLDMKNKDSTPPVFKNIITGYSKNTMKMWECERCHAQLEVSNACSVCHR